MKPELPEHYLVAGLDALARSHPTPDAGAGFGNGHRAASLLSTYFLLQDGLTEPDAEAPIRKLADHWLARPVFAPMPSEPAAPQELDRLLASFARACGTDESHGVIFPSLALRAFRQRPDLITRSRIDGLVRIAEAYTPKQPFAEPQPQQSFSAARFSEEALAGFTASSTAYRGRFQGYTFHVLTFAQAVVDLHALGYADLTRRAEAGFRTFMANCLLGPSGPNHQVAFTVTDPQPQLVRPDLASFWQPLDWGSKYADGLGHLVKYAYAYLTLRRHAGDAGILARSQDVYYLCAWG